ncbi:hypothetical protein ABKN59_006031 [Abortiporus biennis]
MFPPSMKVPEMRDSWVSTKLQWPEQSSLTVENVIKNYFPPKRNAREIPKSPELPPEVQGTYSLFPPFERT